VSSRYLHKKYEMNQHLPHSSSKGHMKKTITLLCALCAVTISPAQNWIQLTVPTTEDIRSSSFISDNEGWIGTDNTGQAIIYHTSDSGTTWNTINVTGAFGGTSYLCFTSPLKGYVVVNTVALKTMDGGITWDPLQLPGIPYYAPYFLNEDTGFISGDEVVYKTTDGGTTWNTYSAATLYHMHFLTDNIGVGSEYDGDIYTTEDGGENWNYYYDGGLWEYYYSACYTQNNLLAYCGYISGGNNWSIIEGDVTYYESEEIGELYDIHFFDGDFGYVAGAGGNVIYSSDGGIYWNVVNLSSLFGMPKFNLYRVDGVNSVYLFGEDGRAFRKNAACSVTTGFNYQVNGTSVQFTDTSINANSWLWDFDDGNTSTLQHPVHTYAAVGNYTVCLTSSYTSCGDDTTCHTITICEPNSSAAIAGTLDDSFDDDGIVTVDYTSAITDYANSIAIQPDGKVISGGQLAGTLARFNPDGSPDTTFGGDGQVTIPIIGIKTRLASDGKIITGGNLDFLPAVTRFNTDGSIDSTFGVNGISSFNIVGDNSQQSLQSMVIQPDDKIVVTGHSSNDKLKIARLNPDGGLDSTFDGDGIRALTEFDGKIYLHYGGDVTLQPDGKIVIVSQGTSNSTGFGIIRLNAQGSIDSTFSDDGYRNIGITSGSSSSEVANCVLIQPDGKILAGGMGGTISETDRTFSMVRLNTNGTNDSSFGTNGIMSFQVDNMSSIGRAAALQTDGKIIMAGYTFKTAGNIKKQCLARLTAVGTLDPAFGNDGMLTTQLYCSPTAAYSVALFDSKIYTGGEIRVNNAYNADVFLARYFAGCSNVITNFTFSASGPDVIFTDNSQFATNWLWDFGDGTIDTSQSPMHTFISPGTYEICLIAGNTCGDDTLCQTVTIIATGIAEQQGGILFLEVSPNPFSNYAAIRFSLENKQSVKLELCDLQGRKIQTIAEGDFEAGDHSLDVSSGGLSKGMYLLRLRTSYSIADRKFIIQ
jgi:uncharacterized delta-60 repeat protein